MGLLNWLSNPVGSAISAVGGLISNQQQAKENEKNRQWSEKMWNLANEYNLPTNQMSRLRDAGLNPNLVYGNGTSTLANYAGNLGTDNSYKNPFANTKLGFIEAQGMQNQTEQTESNIETNKTIQDKNLADAEKARSEAKVNAKVEQYKTTENKYQEVNILLDMAHKGLENSVLELTREYTKDANPLQLSILRESVEKAKFEKQISENTAKKILEEIELVKHQENLVDAQVKTEGAKQGYYVASAAESRANAKKALSEANYYNAKTETERKMLPELLAIQEATLDKLHSECNLNYDTATKLLIDAEVARSNNELQWWIATVRDQYGSNAAVILNNHVKTIATGISDYNEELKNKINGSGTYTVPGKGAGGNW